MKKIFSILSLLGLTALACNAISQTPNLPIKVTATSTDAPASSDPVSGSGPSDSVIQFFSLDNVDSVLPEDVFIEVDYMEHGGPGDSGYCRDENGDPVHYAKPTIIYDPVDNELMVRSTLVTCGWAKNQNLNGTITYPNGRKKSYTLVTDNAGVGTLSFAPSLDDAEGVYIFEISNGDSSLESNAYFYTPSVPRLYYLSENQILFHNFPPSEPVQLVLFSNYSGGDQKADGGMNFIINNTGELVVNVPSKPNSIYVGLVNGLIYEPIDNVDTSHSGLLDRYEQVAYPMGFYGSDEGIEYLEKRKDFEARAVSYRSCPKTIHTNFLPMEDDQGNDQFAKVTASNIGIYTQPRSTARKIREIKKGVALELKGGPYCFDDSIWWYVAWPEIADYLGLSGGGYIIETGNDNKAHIEKQSCGELPTRLSWNDPVRVAFANGFNKNIRKQPGFSAEVLITVPEGTLLRVYERWCVDDSYWWHIFMNDNQQGWIVEMQEGVYLLEPAPK